MRMVVLGSGSGGNATLLQCGVKTLLIDAGLSAKQLVLRMERVGVDPEALDGILLTHEHSDHTRGLDVFLRKRNVPVYANAMTKEALQWGLKSTVQWKVFSTGQAFHIDTIEVYPFAIPHDAAEPVGFTLVADETKFGLVTDVGYTTQSMRMHLKEAHAIFVESNYDEGLLEADTKRPWSTKQRIASRHGHLSNVQAGELMAEVASTRLAHVVLGHLSSDCNTPEVAKKAVLKALNEQHFFDVEVYCASQNEPTDWIEFGREALPGSEFTSAEPYQEFLF